MAKCLVTKLKSTVINENLPLLGDLKVGTLTKNNSKQFQFDGIGSQLELIGTGATISYGGQLQNNPFDLKGNKGSSLILSTGLNEDAEIVIHNKYNLYYFATYYNSTSDFVPEYSFLDLQYCLNLYGYDNRVAYGLTGNYTELFEKMVLNGRTSGNLFVSGNNGLTIFNGTEVVTVSSSTWYRALFKLGGYELYTAANNIDMSGTLLYDSTAN